MLKNNLYHLFNVSKHIYCKQREPKAVKSLNELEAYKMFYSEHYSVDEVLNHMKRFKDYEQDGPSIEFKFNEKEFLSRIDILNMPEDLREYEHKAYNKWFGPQGKTPSVETIKDKLDGYYDLQDLEFSHLLELLDRPIVRVNFMKARGTFLQSNVTEDSRALYNTYEALHKTNSGILLWSDRRTDETRAVSIREAMKKKYDTDVAVVSTRYIRNKPRLIFMTTQADLFRYNRVMHKERSLWKFNSKTVAWKSALQTGEVIYEFVKHVRHGYEKYFEADYEAMDTHVQLEHAVLVLTYLYYNQCISIEQFDEGNKLLHSIFNAPVAAPHGLVTGTHALFSGMPPTNEIESYLNIMIQLAFIEDLHPGARYGEDFILLVLGDDSLLIIDEFKTGWTISDEELIDRYYDLVTPINLVINKDKQRISKESGYFCKRRYSRRNPLVTFDQGHDDRIHRGYFPQYPITLALNSVLHPERSESMTKGMRIIRIWQVLDNAQYHPGYKWLRTFVYDMVMSDKQYRYTLPTQEDLLEWNKLGYNWRTRVLKEKYTIDSSPTALYWCDRVNAQIAQLESKE